MVKLKLSQDVSGEHPQNKPAGRRIIYFMFQDGPVLCIFVCRGQNSIGHSSDARSIGLTGELADLSISAGLCLSICISPVVSLAVASTWISMEAVLWLTPKHSMLLGQELDATCHMSCYGTFRTNKFRWGYQFCLSLRCCSLIFTCTWTSSRASLGDKHPNPQAQEKHSAAMMLGTAAQGTDMCFQM